MQYNVKFVRKYVRQGTVWQLMFLNIIETKIICIEFKKILFETFQIRYVLNRIKFKFVIKRT